jgi:hypothetical protein
METLVLPLAVVISTPISSTALKAGKAPVATASNPPVRGTALP